MKEELLWILPAVPVLAAALSVLVGNARILAAIDIASSLAVFALSARIASLVLDFGAVSAGSLFRADALTAVFLLLIGLLALATAIYSVGWTRHALAKGEVKASQLRYYHALVHGFVTTMLVTVLADNLGVLWITMEGTTITSAVLVGFHGHRYGLEAAWKYIIVTTIGISFGLFGTILMYAAAAHAYGGVWEQAMNWSAIAKIAGKLDPGIVRIAFIFVIVGYGTKAGLAPMHMWLPDAHSQAPTPVSALLSGVLIKCALFGIIRFHAIARGACGPEFSGQLLTLFGILSIIVATPFILAQRDLKRLLGYHSVEHVGIVSLGLGFGGRIGTYGALLHVINHGVTKALVFFVAGGAIERYESRDMRKIKGMLDAVPWAGTFLLLGALSLAGTPPFSIFISELMVLRAGVAGGHYAAVGLFLLMIALIFAGLTHHAGQMAFGAPPNKVSKGGETASAAIGMLLLGAVMLSLGLCIPAALDRLLAGASEVILAE